MYPFQQQQCDQGCPNLDAKRVLADADKGFYRQVLFENLEKQLYFPPLLVNRNDGDEAELEQVGEQYDLPLVVCVPNYDATQRTKTVELNLHAGELDELVKAD